MKATKTHATPVILDERLWKNDQKLIGARIVRVAESLYRARIERDAYDFQCHAVVETWCQGIGWQEIQTVPILDLPVVRCSYTCRRTEDWHPAMQRSLEELCELGVQIMLSGRRD